MSETISVDYLVVGGGAVGLSFADTIISETTKTIAIVDRYARPGGHWTVAYPFVRLHQPASFYGVNSRRLERTGVLDEVGWNKGLNELSSLHNVCDYFEQVMNQTLLPSGRVRYFPKHEYEGEGAFRSIITNKKYRVGSETTIVDATYSRTVVPSMRKPPFEVAPGVELVPINGLPSITRGYANYTVVGSGKTGMDACLWMLENGIEADKITWIRPRDALILERDSIQPGAQFAEKTMGRVGAVHETTMAAESIDDLLKRQVAQGHVLRQLDERVPATTYHCATASELEIEGLRTIRNVVRKGRVTSITPDSVTLEKGSYTPSPDTLYIDCSAGGVPKMTPMPVFRGRNITVQPVRFCQQTFSAAVIAFVEATFDDEKLKNSLCGPVPMPNVPTDHVLTSLQTNINALRWQEQPKMVAWLHNCRLNHYDQLLRPPPDPEQHAAFYEKLLVGVKAEVEKMWELVEKLPEKEKAGMKAQLQMFE